MSINPDKIRDVIGPSGKQINKIIEDTGVKIDIEQDGTIFISSTDESMNQKAKKIIEDLVREVEVGQLYLGKVKRIENSELSLNCSAEKTVWSIFQSLRSNG